MYWRRSAVEVLGDTPGTIPCLQAAHLLHLLHSACTCIGPLLHIPPQACRWGRGRYFASLPANKLELWFALEAERFQACAAHANTRCCPTFTHANTMLPSLQVISAGSLSSLRCVE